MRCFVPGQGVEPWAVHAQRQAKKRLLWRCPLDPNHEWVTKVFNVCELTGCPHCSVGTEENRVGEFLRNHCAEVIRQFPIAKGKGTNNCTVDFKVRLQSSDVWIVIEVDGVQHFIGYRGAEHLLSEQQRTDLEKMKAAHSQGRAMVRVLARTIRLRRINGRLG